MIGMLTGTIAEASLGQVTVDVQGVGYEVLVAPGTVTTQIGSQVTLHTHLVVREDSLTLYGFGDAGARAVFTTLLGITGVGPKIALAALGTLGGDGLRRAVVAEDVNAITVVPGIGKKGAQRMILELREKLGAPGEGVPDSAAGAPVAADPHGEVAEALESLGYASKEVRAVLKRLPEDGAAEDLLREALRSLGQKS